MYPTKKLWEIWIFNRWITYNKWDLLESYQKWCVTLLRANNINDWLFLDDLQYLPWWFVKNDKILQKDDIIFCMSSWSKHLVWKNAIISSLDNFSFWAFCSMFRKNTNDDINYISYYFKSDLYKKYIFNFSQWVNILNLKNSDLENCEIPLPPLPTQKLIVQKLDSAFENINKQIDLVKKNLSSLEELNKSVLEKVFSEWEYEMKKLWEITSILWDWLHGTPKYTENWDFFFINWNNLDDWNIIFKDWTKKVNIIEYEKYKKILNSQTIFVSINWTIGNTSFYNNEKIILWKSVCYFNLNENIDKFYVRYFIKSKYFFDYINKEYTWTTIKNVSLKSMRNLKMPLPPLQKQKEIVTYLDQIFAKNKELKIKYENQLKHLEELKQSLLKDAFEWRLVKE